MNRIDELFTKKQENILNIYFTAGYPNLEDTIEIALELEKNGADLLEIGMPFSDPLADGPTIQESGQMALKNGMNVNLLFDQIIEIRKQSNIPIILMGYFNQVMRYGEETFFRKCKSVGVDGVILPDMPIYVYEENYKNLFEELDLGITFLGTPQTDDNRFKKIDDLTRGFIYLVSSAAITGGKSGVSNEQTKYFERINQLNLKHTKLVGFGISDHQSFSKVCEYANGGIIGSAFIRALSKEGTIHEKIVQFIDSILLN